MRSAIFDLDGTLADSAPDIAAAFNAALVEAGHAAFSVPVVTAMVGEGARKLVERALIAHGVAAGAADVGRLHARFLAHYDAHPCVHTKLYPGARDALDALAADGWRLAVCTNKPEPLAVQVLDALGIAPLFGAIVGGRDGVPLKPAAAMVHLALAGLSGAGARAVFIGDSHADLAAARAARLPVILMAHGYSDRPVAAMGADGVVEGFAGLVAMLRSVAGTRER